MRPYAVRGWLASGAMLLCLIAAGPASAAPPLVGEWHLDENTASGPEEPPDRTPDSSGNGRDLTSSCQGCSDFAEGGRFGSYYSEISNGPMLTSGIDPQRVTLIAWARADSFNSDARVIAGRGVDGVTCQEMAYVLRSEGGDTEGGDSGASFSIRRPDGSSVSAPVYSGFADNQWHMLAGVFDGSSVRLYVDGNEVGSGTPAGTAAIGYGAGGRFGIDGYSGSACPNAEFPGGIDEVREYSRALSATEIATLASPSATQPPELPPDAPGTPPSQPPVTPAPTPPSPPGPFLLDAEMTSPGISGDFRVIDVSATRGSAEVFKYDLDGDKKDDVSCPGSQPFLGVTNASPAKSTVTMTAVSGTRTSSTVLPNLFIPGRGLPATVVKSVPPKAVCAPKITMLSFAAISAPSCQDQTVIFRLVEAQGCFTRIREESEIPGAEAALIKSRYESLIYPKIVFTICAQEAAGNQPKGKCDQAKKALKSNIDVYYSTRAVKMNGITITPKGGRAVVVFPTLQRVASANATATWGGMVVRTGKFDLNLADITRVIGGSNSWPAGRSAAIAYYDGRKDIPAIAGFKLDGQVKLALEAVDGQRYSSGVLSVQLPPEFGIFGGNPPSGMTRLLGNNKNGVVFDSLELQMPEAHLGGVRFSDLRFRYALHGGLDRDQSPNSRCSRKQWKAQANVFIGGGESGEAGFKLSPPPSQNGVGFCAGAFRHAGGAVIFGGPIPKPQIFPGVLLDEINFAIQLKPTLVRGGGAISAGGITRVRGAVLVALATPWQPYTLTPQDAGVEFRQLAGRRFTSTTIAGGGAVDMKFPGVGYIPVGDAAVMYSDPDYFFGAGKVRVVVPGMSVTGGASVSARPSQGLFDSYVGGEACLAGVKRGACLGADGWVSSKGMVACLNLANVLRPGAGITWATRRVELWLIDGCEPSRYWVTVKPAQARAAADRLTFTVARGERVKNVKVDGRGGAPLVQVRAPDGETLTVNGDDFARSRHMAGVRHTVNGTAYLGVRNGTPGTYTITKLPGSADLGGLSATRPGYDTKFSAKISGRGARRTLTYDARKRGGQRVTFYERGNNVMKAIKTVTGGRGKVDFKPSFGPGGRRQIVAQATVDGIAIRPQTLATFRMAAPRRTGKPRRVLLTRRGGSLLVSWSKARGATRYGVLVKETTGRQRQFKVGAGRRSLRVRRFPLTEGARVYVSAQGGLGDWAKPRASNRINARRRAYRALQDSAHNERRTAQKRKAEAKKRKARARAKAPKRG